MIVVEWKKEKESDGESKGENSLYSDDSKRSELN